MKSVVNPLPPFLLSSPLLSSLNLSAIAKSNQNGWKRICEKRSEKSKL